MPSSSASIATLQSKIWSGSIPLEIRLAASDCRTYNESEPYLVQHPRLSYLTFLLPRLQAFFAPSLIDPGASSKDAWFSFEDVPLKWHYPLGLLYDLFSGAGPAYPDQQSMVDPVATLEGSTGGTTVQPLPIPWRLTLHYTEFPGDVLIQPGGNDRAMLDSFINSVKEADFIRNGTARAVMSLGKEDSDNLWRAVQSHNLALFNTVNTKLLNPPGVEIRNIPLKIYLPTSASSTSELTTVAEEAPSTAHIRVIQSLVPKLVTPGRTPQTLGMALNLVLPTIFPSRRNPLLAQPVLHGAVTPMSANLEELGKACAYSDGFLHVAVVMLG